MANIFNRPIPTPKPTLGEILNPGPFEDTVTQIKMREDLNTQMRKKYQDIADRQIRDAITNGVGQININPGNMHDPLGYQQVGLGQTYKGPTKATIGNVSVMEIMSDEEMLVKLFVNDPKLIEALSILAEKENVSTMDIIIYMLDDYLRPIHCI